MYLLYGAILLWTISGCAPIPEHGPFEKEGKRFCTTEGPFNGWFWNYYERGVSCLEGGYLDEAEYDFKMALKKRDVDKIRTRTFGFHVIDYFAHRELGITYYQQKEYALAIQELTASLRTEKSAKAEFYLDSARKRLIENNDSDRNPPEISMTFPEQGYLTNTFFVFIEGRAVDDTFVKNIRINREKLRVDVSKPDVEFRKKVSLHAGVNMITIQAEDIMGKTTTVRRTVVCDQVAPVISIDTIRNISYPRHAYVLQGYAHDDHDIASITLNGHPVLKHSTKEFRFSHLVYTDGKKDAQIVAIDKAGNRTTVSLPHTPFPSSSQSDTPLPMLYAGLMTDIWQDSPAPDPTRPKSPFTSRYATDDRHDFPTTHEDRGRIDSINREKLGEYHALIIGITDYHAFNSLPNALNDAYAMKEVLEKRYGFQKENTRLLIDSEASKLNIIGTLREMIADLRESDNLHVFYAGHGQYDDETKKGYWIPVDGAPALPNTWIPHRQIRDMLIDENLKAKNIMLISDSCYSRDLIPKDTPKIMIHPEHELINFGLKKSRQVISAGGINEGIIEEVMDAGTTHHSVFAEFLLENLWLNKQKLISVAQLVATRVFFKVVESSIQHPTVGRWHTPMDEGGLFLLALQDPNVLPEKFFSKQTLTVMRYGEEVKDVTDPVIHIVDDLSGKVVFADNFFLEGSVEDDSQVTSLRINGKELLRRISPKVYFHSMEYLHPGKNTFHIVATDSARRRSEKEVVIYKQKKKVYRYASRMSILLFPNIANGMNAPGIDEYLHGYLKDSGRFRMKSRNTRIGVFRTHRAEDEYDWEVPLNIARNQNVEFVFMESIVQTESSVEIWLKVVDVETGEIVAKASVYGEDTRPDYIRLLCRGIVFKICDELPLVEGMIALVNEKDNVVIVNIGEKDHLKEGMYLIFFEEGEPVPDPLTGEPMERDVVETGEARVIKVLNRSSNAKPLDVSILPFLEIGGRVVTK